MVTNVGMIRWHIFTHFFAIAFDFAITTISPLRILHLNNVAVYSRKSIRLKFRKRLGLARIVSCKPLLMDA